MAEANWLDEREAALWQALLELIRRIGVATERQLLDSGLSGAEFALLVPLSEAPDGVVRAASSAGPLAGIAAGWLTSCGAWSAGVLIERTGCADDARATMVAATDAGRRAVEGAAPGHVETVRIHLFDKLDVADVDILTDICARLLERDVASR